MSDMRRGLRQAIYAALTPEGGLQYQTQTGTATLPVDNVVPKAVNLAGGTQAPSPLVAYSVATRGQVSRGIGFAYSVKVWVVSSLNNDEPEDIWDAISRTLNLADMQGGAYAAPDLSRAGGGAVLPVALYEMKVTRVSDTAFEEKTSRWYLTAELSVVGP